MFGIDRPEQVSHEKTGAHDWPTQAHGHRLQRDMHEPACCDVIIHQAMFSLLAVSNFC